jgi:hypothetical protein
MIRLYVLMLLTVVLAFGVGVKLGRYYPHHNDVGFMLYHPQPNMFDWLRRPVRRNAGEIYARQTAAGVRRGGRLWSDPVSL